MMKKKMTVAAATLALALLGPNAQANLVQDGSFESVALANGAYTYLRNGQLANWAMGAAGVEVRNNIVGKAYDGNNYVELDAYGANSFISQTLNTVAGQWYELKFAYANRLWWPASSNGLSWEVGGKQGSVPALPFNGTGVQDWRMFSVLWQASSDSSVLKISATGVSDGAGSSLDAISVTPLSPVPEPQSASLLLLGLLGMTGWVARQRKPRH